MVRDFFGDDKAAADKVLWKIKDCVGIEDVFSRGDFVRYVLREDGSKVTGRNSDYLRGAKRSKPVMAYQFWADVQSGKITAATLEADSLNGIKSVVSEISKRLSALPA